MQQLQTSELERKKILCTYFILKGKHFAHNKILGLCQDATPVYSLCIKGEFLQFMMVTSKQWYRQYHWSVGNLPSIPMEWELLNLSTHWPLGDLNDKTSNFQANFSDGVISCKIALRCMSLGLSDDKSTLVQVMALCCQTASHYLRQCWPSSMPQYGINGPQSINYILFP